MTTKPVGTPARNNYANPQSPIASAKRPRSSLERPLVPKTPNDNNSSADMVTPRKPTASATGLTPSLANIATSPMHPPRAVHRDEADGYVVEDENEDSSSWVGKKVDALFSPVLSFLSSAKDEEDAAMEEEEESKVAKVSDDDTQPTTTTLGCKDSSEEEDFEEPQDINNIEEDPSSSFEEEEFNPFSFIKNLPPYASVQGSRPAITLPPKSADAPKVTLVLDLDETLVHCTVEPVQDADLKFPVMFHGIQYEVYVRLRPHLFKFLELIKDKYEVIVFTASQQVYANELLNLIDKNGEYIHHRLYRESCLQVEGNFLKDLNVLGRDLTKTVLVDNSPHAFGYQVDNGIPIESWFDDPNDTELLKLERFLRTLHDVDDVRTAVRWKFQTYQFIDEA